MIDKNKLAEINQLIRSGKTVAAREFLQDANLKKVPSPLVEEFAQLLIRAGLPKRALLFLYKKVYPEAGIRDQASDLQKGIYALSLSQVGAADEAIKLIGELKTSKVPQLSFYKAIVHMTQWDYKSSIPLLKKYLESELSPYEKLVAQVNLAAALVAEDEVSEGKNLLQVLIEETKVQKHLLLYSNSLGLYSQVLIKEKKYTEAQSFLNRAQKHFGDKSSKYLLFTEKWKLFAALAKDSKDKKVLLALKELRKASIDQEHWQTARECDFFQALFTRDDALFFKVYFGTPFPAYRERLLKSYGQETSLPDYYIWNPMQTPLAEENYFDELRLKSGQIYTRLFYTLKSDFYTAFRTETLFSKIFPDEYYNPVSSDQKIYTAINRFSQWLEKNDIPLIVRHYNSGYRLFVTSPLGIRVQLRAAAKLEPHEILLLREHFKKGIGFAISDAIRVLSLPRSTAKRKLSDLVNEGLISIKGQGRSQKYFLD